MRRAIENKSRKTFAWSTKAPFRHKVGNSQVRTLMHPVNRFLMDAEKEVDCYNGNWLCWDLPIEGVPRTIKRDDSARAIKKDDSSNAIGNASAGGDCEQPPHPPRSHWPDSDGE